MFLYKDFQTVSLENKRFYSLDYDVYYPSITTVLGLTQPDDKKLALENWKKSFGEQKANAYSKAAANRGTVIHELTEKHLKNEFIDYSKYEQSHVNLFNSLKLSLKNIKQIYGQEVVLYSHIFQIAGRCDLIGKYLLDDAIVDYKTSSRVKSNEDIKDYWLQTCFYALSHNEMYGTDINKLVIIMGVENGLPLIFRKTITDDLIEELASRTQQFYKEL